MGEVISLVEKEKDKCARKVLEIIDILGDYDVFLEAGQDDILLILNTLYDLYSKKKIAYQFEEDMLLYFNEICRDVAEVGELFDFSVICNGFMGCCDLMLPVGIEKKEFEEVFKKVKVKIDSRRQESGKRECYKKL